MNLGRENESQEFKLGLGQLERGIKSLTAMLNRHGNGCVYFGVDDNGEVKGLLVGRETLSDIRRKVRDLVSPRVLCDIEELKDEQGRSYIKVFAEGNDIPYSCDGRFYVRNVSSDEQADGRLLRKMLAAGGADPIREMCSRQSELTFNGFYRILSGEGIHVKRTRSFLESYGLVHEGHFNLMAELLSDQSMVRLSVTTFAGKDKVKMLQRKDFKGQCLLASVRELQEFIKLHNTVDVDLSQGPRIETPLFDYEAFREAWINACVHNAWNEGLPPAVHIFDDRLEVVSYGGLPFGLSRERFFKGVSAPVNRALFTLFLACNFAEQSGHGVPLIASSCGRKAFDIEDDMLVVTIKFARLSDAALARDHIQTVTQTITQTVTQTNGGVNKVEQIIAVFKAQPTITQIEMANKIGVSLDAIKVYVSRLKKRGILRRIGTSHNGHWEVLK